MSRGACSCVAAPCGCCEGVLQLTPVEVHNRPGLDALSSRVGTHAQFFETMQARLSTITVQGVRPDGQGVETWRPLQSLTTRDRGDLSMALLDGWATIADVLTFYQERIANEGFLRTATERRSVLQLSRLVGHALRPGVAATVYLAYTVDEKQSDPVTIATGSRAQSIPAPGESPQTFETGEDVIARGAWNNLQVRLHRPHHITLDSRSSLDDDALKVDALVKRLKANRHALAVDTIHVAGTGTNLKPGDKLLLVFSGDGDASDKGVVSVVRSVTAVDTVFADQRTAVALHPVDRKAVACVPLLIGCIAELKALDSDPPNRFLDQARTLLTRLYLGLSSDPAQWADSIEMVEGVPVPDSVKPVAAQLRARIKKVLESTGNAGDKVVTRTSAFMKELLVPKVPQVANGTRLPRSLSDSFAGERDASSQLVVQFAPELRGSFYRALSGADVNPAVGSLENVYALRMRAPLFGAAASKIPAFFPEAKDGHVKGQLMPQSAWTDDWLYADDESGKNAFLDQAYEAIVPGSYVLMHVNEDAGPVRQVRRIAAASVTQRSEYGVSGPSTALLFDGDDPWRSTVDESVEDLVRQPITTLRKTQIYAQSEPLSLVDEPIVDPVGGQEIELGAVYSELKSGRWVILSGERADILGVRGVSAAELLMVSGLRHGFDSILPGDQMHTTLILATKTAYQYKRDTLTIYGNVVRATNGETHNEVLGSGDGAQSLQSFTLQQRPLTFVPAPTVAGAESTLQVFVDGVEWHETDSLAGLGPREHRFVTVRDDAETTQLIFGNGLEGARLPSGVQNVSARYRHGIGAGGNVKAEQISLLQTRPLGVTAVINPLRASGGADPEPRDLARESAPLSVMPLDRLVSVQDYADFTRSFAGIAKSVARQASDGRRQLVHLTIAGVDDIPIDPTSDLYRNLLIALRKLGDRDLPVRVDLRELTALVLSAGVKLLPDYSWEPVATAIRARLLDVFGFAKRALGQPALRCEVTSVIQGVRGVAYVDIDAFGGVPEKKIVDGARVFLDPDDIASAVAAIVGQASADPALRVDAFPGGFDHGSIRPAELVILTPAVPETLVLNQLP